MEHFLQTFFNINICCFEFNESQLFSGLRSLSQKKRLHKFFKVFKDLLWGKTFSSASKPGSHFLRILAKMCRWPQPALWFFALSSFENCCTTCSTKNLFRWTSKFVCEITNLFNNPPPIWSRQSNFGIQTKLDQKLNHKIRNIFVTTVGIHVFWYQWAGTDRPKHSEELTKSAKISILNFQSSCEIKNLPQNLFLNFAARWRDRFLISQLLWKFRTEIFALFVSSSECFGRSVPAHWYQNTWIPTVVTKMFLILWFNFRTKFSWNQFL